MKNFTAKGTLNLILTFFFLVISVGLKAQETTATLSGNITDEKGQFVIGASIVAKYEPTGNTVQTVSNKKGIFVITNLKPGGPYTIRITYIGYKEEVLENISLSLGNNPDVNLALKQDSKQLQEVVITGKKLPSTGGTNIGRAQLATLPTLGRSIQDFTRLTPQSNNNSFAGTNFRYNNFTLDGAVNNDAIGFSNSAGGVSGGGQSGTAGAGTRTNPYSLEAIQEVQVQLTPFDVKIGNFTGGSVNAVTKSGSNTVHGSLYTYGRNQVLTGKSVDGKKSSIGSDYYDYQAGGSLSGPIIKNKLFYFVNAELTRRQEPTFYNAGDPGSAITLKEAQDISNYLQTKYGYDVGSYGAYKIFTNSNKFFGRLDWNVSNKSTLMLRGIYTDGSGNNLERSSTNFQFSSVDFTQHTKNLNLVAEYKTRFSNFLNNNLIVSYINVHEYRDFPGTLAPFIDIDNGRIWAGTWREASIYNMKQKTIEVSDNLTYTKGIHKITVGTHNEFYNLSYGFINSWNGRWEYSRGINSFLADNPSRVRGAFTLDGKTPNNRDYLYNNPPNPFKVALLSAYAQDEIAVSRNFKVTPGLRVDYSAVADQPTLDPAVNTTKDYVSPNPTYTHTPFSELNNKWLGKATLSPRLGFNYDINSNQSVVLRGGTGIFTGRMPFAWLGYAYTLNGTTYGNIDWNSIAAGTTVPLAINPLGLKDTVTKYGGASRSNTREVDLIDNNFKLPRIWRSNLALDVKFGNGYKMTFDALYTKTLYDVKFEQINLKDSVAYFPTGQAASATPVYVGGKLNSVFSNAFFLTNTTEGYRYNLTFQISKVTNNIKAGSHLLNINWSAAYTYGMSKDISNGIRNSFQSNYEVNPSIVPSNSTLSYSNFDLRHRIVGMFGTSMMWNKKNTTSWSFFYSGQSGSPYSLVYQSAPFGNGSNAPLPYIPVKFLNFTDIKDAGGNVTYSAAQQINDMNAFIDGDKYLRTRRGQYAERNGLRTPWNHQLDMKLVHEFKMKNSNHSLRISLDIFNVLNLLNNDWGHINFVTNINNYTVNFLKFVKDANGKNPGAPSTGYTPTFNFVKPLDGHYYTVDPINSRWQGQLGIHYTF
ncbi:MAG: TonB-dependent receptor [Sphingobacteriales bacterium]|nr:TonB-dependent receptor [Sphingobacteriales bacterium]